MTLPVVLQQFLLLLNNVIDRIWIAHIPDVGQLAFTASGVCVPIIYIILAIAELVGTGVSPRVGFLLGQGRRREAERTLGSMAVLCLLLALAVCLLIEGCCPWLISLFGGSEHTADMAATYLRISTPGNALCIVSGGLAPFLLSQGLSRQAGIVLGSGIVFNMLLDPVFIFLFGWGIAGAAWATTVAETVAAILAVYMLYRVSDLKIRRANLRFQWTLAAPCLALGITPMVIAVCLPEHAAGHEPRKGHLLARAVAHTAPARPVGVAAAPPLCEPCRRRRLCGPARDRRVIGIITVIILVKRLKCKIHQI